MGKAAVLRPVKVLATRRLPGEAWEELGPIEIGPIDGRRDDVEALVVSGDIVDDSVLDRLPALRLVANYGVGYDNVDAEACRARGVAVTNTPGVLDAATADLAIALMLAVRRRVVEGHELVREGRWGSSWSEHPFLGRDLSGARLGIVGLGRIGKRMAHISRNTFKRVIACDPYLIDGDFPAYVERADLAALFEASDVVSLHTPLNDETRGMIDERVLRRMRPGSFLVNTARGAVVAIDHLLDALDSGILAGAGLDVLPVEPPAPESRLLGHPKVILTPHVAYFSAQSEIELRRKAAQNIVTWVKTGRPDYVVVTGARHPRA